MFLDLFKTNLKYNFIYIFFVFCLMVFVGPEPLQTTLSIFIAIQHSHPPSPNILFYGIFQSRLQST